MKLLEPKLSRFIPSPPDAVFDVWFDPASLSTAASPTTRVAAEARGGWGSLLARVERFFSGEH